MIENLKLYKNYDYFRLISINYISRVQDEKQGTMSVRRIHFVATQFVAFFSSPLNSSRIQFVAHSIRCIHFVAYFLSLNCLVIMFHFFKNKSINQSILDKLGIYT